MRLTLLILLAFGGCKRASDIEEPLVPADGIAVLGGGTHSLDAMTLQVLATGEAGLKVPVDIAMHPSRDELWVVNQWEATDDAPPRAGSVMVVYEPGAPSMTMELFRDTQGGRHFLPRPSALAFSADNGNFATSHDTDELTQGANGTPSDFMGPTLWPSDDQFDAGHASHLDMLHNSPLAKGIAWDSGNAFWVVDGAHSSLTYYDFAEDHGYGGADHSDGRVLRYVEGEIEVSPDYPAHAVMDHKSGLLYAVDPGHGRVVALDTASGVRGQGLRANYDGLSTFASMDDAVLTTAIDLTAAGLEQPVGLRLHDDLLYVSDAGTGTIWAFTLEGEMVDYLELGGSPHGIELGQDGSLYVADAVAEQVLRLTPR